jgi:sphinganine-1-phosphate aldolase
LVDELSLRGWHAQPQLADADLPRSIHLTVTAAVADRAGEFGSVLRQSATAARAMGPVQVPGELVSQLQLLSRSCADLGC